MTDLQAQCRGEPGQTLARTTLDLLRGYDIPTTPANYELWLTHAAGARHDLSQAITAHLEVGAPFTDAVNDALHDRFFANTRLTVEMMEASETIARELIDIVQRLRGAGAQSGAFAEALETAVQKIEVGSDPSTLRTVIAGLAVATREMVDHNRNLVDQMQASSRQVEALQTTLHNVKVEALTDGLTGVANRRCFDETLRRRVDEAVRNGEELCLMLCDIDHFKRFNDTWGHLVGDQVLRLLGAVLREKGRPDFLAARFGGEEFALIMPRTTLEDGLAYAAEIHAAVQSKRLTRRSTGEAIGSVTVSMGVSQYRPNESAVNFIARVDACLYASKRSGRDRITSDPPRQASAA